MTLLNKIWPWSEFKRLTDFSRKVYAPVCLERYELRKENEELLYYKNAFKGSNDALWNDVIRLVEENEKLGHDLFELEELLGRAQERYEKLLHVMHEFRFLGEKVIDLQKTENSHVWIVTTKKEKLL